MPEDSVARTDAVELGQPDRNHTAETLVHLLNILDDVFGAGAVAMQSNGVKLELFKKLVLTPILGFISIWQHTPQ